MDMCLSVLCTRTGEYYGSWYLTRFSMSKQNYVPERHARGLQCGVGL